MEKSIERQMFFTVAQSVEAMGHPTEPVLKTHCVAGLSEFAERLDFYKKYATTSLPFMDELESNVQLLARQVQQLSPNQIADFAFMMVESMAVVMKEAVVKSGVAFSSVEKEFFRYFENSGHWQEDDATLVSEYYYRRLSPLTLEE